MKKLLLLLLPLASLLAACASSKTEDPTPAAPKHAVGWLVDGTTITTESWVSGSGGNQSWKIPGAAVIHVEGRYPGTGNATSSVMLEVPPAVGTYPFGPSTPSWATYTMAGVKYYAGTSPGYTGSTVLGAGTIVVTGYTASNITGTFSFTAVDPATGAIKTVAGGKFYVPI